MFFNDWTKHRIYMDRGDYNLHYQLKIIIASMLISALLTSAVECFISSYEIKIDNIEKGSNDENDKINIRCLKVIFICFFVILILFILFF